MSTETIKVFILSLTAITVLLMALPFLFDGYIKFKTITGKKFSYTTLKYYFLLDFENISNFKDKYPLKLSLQDALKICEDSNLINFAKGIIHKCPYKFKKLVFENDTILKNLFYAGNVIAKTNLKINNSIITKGKLHVKKELNISNSKFSACNSLIVNDILTIKNSKIHFSKKVKAKKLIICDNSTVYYNKCLIADTLHITENSVLISNKPIFVKNLVIYPGCELKILNNINCEESFRIYSSQLTAMNLISNSIILDNSKLRLFDSITCKEHMINRNSEFSCKAKINYLLTHKE